MPTRGQAITLGYYAWDTANSVPKTGDVANHTIRLMKDGVVAVATNAPAEADATNLKGWYKLLLTAAECTADVVVLGGVSSTSGVTISGTQVTFEAAAVSIDLAQTGLVPRALDAVADAALTVGDALVAAVAGAAGRELIVGTAYTVMTPAGTTIQTFTLDSGTNPTSRT